MSATAPELADRAHGAVERLAAAITTGGSAAHLQLICSELFEALQAELKLVPASETAKHALVSTALDLCTRSADQTVNASLRLAQLRAMVALLQGGLPSAVPVSAAGSRFRVIRGGLA